VQQLQNIAQNSEIKHIDAVNELAIKYDLNMTQYPDTEASYSNSKGIESEKDALEVGCMVEVVDIIDLDKYMELAKSSNASDVLDIFDFLRKGSYTHYWAFDQGLKDMGVADGCCSVDDALGYNFCHPEYPQTEQGGGHN